MTTKNVLIVSDEDVIKTFETALSSDTLNRIESFDLNFHGTDNPFSALQILSGIRFHVVIINFNMQYRKGEWLAHEIAEKHPNLPVIFIGEKPLEINGLVKKILEILRGE